MQRHHEKRRDMARSILPAKNREPARAALAATKRAHRRAVAQELRGLITTAEPETGAAETYDGWDEHHDVGRSVDHDIRSLMWRRRGGDKLNHFIRWAIAVTAELPLEDRLPELQALLPDGLIGRHALSHLQYEAELRPALDHDRRHLEDRTGWARRRRAHHQARRKAELEVIRGLLRAVVEQGDLARFNRVMKTCDLHAERTYCDAAGCVRRCLAGVHDIDAFIAEVAAIGTDQGRQWSLPEGPAGLPARRLAQWLTSLRLAGAQGRPDHARPSGGGSGS